MFAIEITIENMPKIRQYDKMSDEDKTQLELYLRSPKTWYLVQGYSPRRGPLIDWIILPANILEKFYEYNPFKIKTDWDLIVRKS